MQRLRQEGYGEIVTWQVRLREGALTATSTARVEGTMAHGPCAAAGSGGPDGDTEQWPT